VCLSVCLPATISQKPDIQTSPNFSVCFPWPWLDLYLTTLRYVISGFVDDVMFAHNGQAWPTQKECMLKATHRGSTRAKSDVYYCLFTLPLVGVQNIVMSIFVYLSVCLSVCYFVCLLAYPRNHMALVHHFCMFLWQRLGRHCDTLCTSGFVDDVMFSHNWLYGASCVRLQWLRL